MSSTLHLTVDEYDRMVACGAFDHLNRKIELIRGEICEINPAGPVHDDFINYLLNWSIRETPQQAVRVTAQTGLDLTELESRPEPDLLWIKAGRYRDRHPGAKDVKLAIEVADNSLAADMNRKAALYAQAKIVEYWIVDVNAECIHLFRDPIDGIYTDRSVAKVGELLSPLEPCEKPLDLKDLFEGK